MHEWFFFLSMYLSCPVRDQAPSITFRILQVMAASDGHVALRTACNIHPTKETYHGNVYHPFEFHRSGDQEC
jgi:hypothetical protein